jgi:hypothetical protein
LTELNAAAVKNIAEGTRNEQNISRVSDSESAEMGNSDPIATESNKIARKKSRKRIITTLNHCLSIGDNATSDRFDGNFEDEGSKAGRTF